MSARLPRAGVPATAQPSQIHLLFRHAAWVILAPDLGPEGPLGGVLELSFVAEALLQIFAVRAVFVPAVVDVRGRRAQLVPGMSGCAAAAPRESSGYATSSEDEVLGSAPRLEANPPPER